MEINYSVLMSVYKNERPEEFKLSVESMLNQTYKTNQFVIVKDGPLTKELDAAISDFKEENPNIFTIIPLEKNIGLGKALDVGIKYVENELIARMDADDISLPTRCEKQIEYFKNDPELDIVGTYIDEFYDKPKNVISRRVVPTEHDEIVKFMRRRSPFNHPTVMYKKSSVINAGGYGKMRRKQDLDLFSRMINNNVKTTNIGESLLLFRSNEDNFKRRKSWSYCKSYIEVQYAILRRGHCNLFDFIYVVLGQCILFLMPMPILKNLINKCLRG